MRSLVLRAANRSDHSLHHHVCLVVKHGNILITSVNTGWRHAEENAIRTLGRKSPNLLRGATLYSFRVGKGQILRNAKPCIGRGDGRTSCSELIRLAGIKWVIYSGQNGEMIREKV